MLSEMNIDINDAFELPILDFEITNPTLNTNANNQSPQSLVNHLSQSPRHLSQSSPSQRLYIDFVNL